MSAPAADGLRPPTKGFKVGLAAWMMAGVPFVFGLLRTIWPIPCASGVEGRLLKRGGFADRLVVNYDRWR